MIPDLEYDYSKFDSKNSYIVGFYFRANAIDNFHFVFGINYNHIITDVKASESSPSHHTNYDYRPQLGYISLYFLPEYSIGTKIQLSINAGP